MELYTINVNDYYAREEVIDEYESVVWTERFIEPGDMKLVLPATFERVKMLKPGTLLGLNGSREPMLIDTRKIKDTMLEVTGKTIEAFFEERYADAITMTGIPGAMLKAVVDNMQERYDGFFALPRLRTGMMASGWDEFTEEIAYGRVHTTLLGLANKYQIGMNVYRVSHETVGHELVFSSYAGVDRTTGQSDDMVRFSPALDTLAEVNELLSELESRSIGAALPPRNMTQAEGMDPSKRSRVPNGNTIFQPFSERVVEVECDDITYESLSGETDEERLMDLRWKMDARAIKALRAAKRKTNAIDGEIIEAASQYKYYTEYNADVGDNTPYRLGDKIEVAGHFTGPQKGIITEFIRSRDATGPRAYPTIIPEGDVEQTEGGIT